MHAHAIPLQLGLLVQCALFGLSFFLRVSTRSSDWPHLMQSFMLRRYPMTPLEYGPTLGHSSPIASKPHDSALAEDDANFDFNPDPIGFATMNATMNATSLATATAVQSSIRGIKDQPSCAANYHPPTQPEARRQSTQAPGVYVHAAPAGPVHQPSQASRRDPPAKKKKTKVCVIM
jgi:hypothetical protein